MNNLMRAAAASTTVALLMVVCMTTVGANAGFTASVKNTSNSVGSGTSFITAGPTINPACTSVPSNGIITATDFFGCTGNQFPATVNPTGSTSAATQLTATGTANFTAASYSATSCVPVRLANSTTPADPMLVRSGVSFAQPGPPKVIGSGALGVDGSTGLAADVVQSLGPQDSSYAVWFKTSVAGGALTGFADDPSENDATNYDRMIYLNSSGNVVFGAGTHTVQSSSNYADGAWHHAVATLDSQATKSKDARETLYVDGVSVATTIFKAPAGQGANVYNGWWRIGNARSTTADGWTGNTRAFSGSLSNFAVFPVVLTAANVTSLWNATSQAGLNTVVGSLGATNSWHLDDDGQQGYSGVLPNGAGNPCGHIRATVGTVTKCFYPSQLTVCPSLSSAYTLAGLTAAGVISTLAPVLGNSQTITTTTARDTGYNPAYDGGLHLLVPVVLVERGFTQTFSWANNQILVTR